MSLTGQKLLGLLPLPSLKGLSPFRLVAAPKLLKGEYLIVGGGARGAGGSAEGSGGSGGGGVDQSAIGLRSGTHTVTVAATKTTAGNGNFSSLVHATLGTILYQPGGGSGGDNNVGLAGSGGSGGGAQGATLAVGQIRGDPIDARYGKPGGPDVAEASAIGSGGGGAKTGGGRGFPSAGGAGGQGITSDITGTAVVYGSGSGGAGTFEFGADRFANGTSGTNAGVSSTGAAAGTAAVANTGSAGGSGGFNFDSVLAIAGGNGASGIFVFRYPGDRQICTGGTVTYLNGWVVHTFTSSGSLVVP